MDYQQKANQLFGEQAENWPLLHDNLEGLNHVKVKSFEFDGFTINVQFNPKRIRSSAAKVDKKSIDNRQCFLCSKYRPAEQNEVGFGEEYEILCNPFPIFQKHYTIAHKKHVVQQIGSSFGHMLDLSNELKELVIFYNAPKCGASAPDHLHFQAGNTGLMPVEKDIVYLKESYGISLVKQDDSEVSAIADGLRKFILIESSNRNEIEAVFQQIYNYTQKLDGGEEPMLNVLSYYDTKWKVMVFPRDKHRPWQFYEEGEDNILLSPASVDMGGTLIIPLKKDFDKIIKEDIRNIFSQVSMSEERFEGLVNQLKKS